MLKSSLCDYGTTTVLNTTARDTAANNDNKRIIFKYCVPFPDYRSDINNIQVDNAKVKNIYRIQSIDSVICGYFCIGFTDFMLKGKSLLDYPKLFSPNEYGKNDKIILICSQWLKICFMNRF